MDANDARTFHMRLLVAKAGGPAEWARQFGGSRWQQPQVSQWISEANPKGIGKKLARDLETAQNLPRGCLDVIPNGSAEPFSTLAAQPLHPVVPRTRRVAIRGNAVMDKDGFWTELDQSRGDEWHEAVTDDPAAYALRIMGRRYSPAIESGWCVLMEPSRPLRVESSVLITLKDGRHAIRKFLKHDRSLWAFMSVLDSNDILELNESEVATVHRITNRFETD